ncbi:MAG: acylphosphatase [Gemmatimonadaceae bacterium]|nr:acylphosphatase [Gemmatimonadaceae bacterium]
MQIVHLEIAGHVQGVGFRHFVRQHASRLGIAGWVRNLSSGNLECTAAGSPVAIEEFVGILRQGPPEAVVKQVITLTPPHNPELPMPFTILK